MNNSNILLSICIPTYNRSEQLKTTLNALIPQLKVHDTIEIVVSDNASEDKTENTVKELIKECNKIKYIKNDKNIGLDYNALSCVKHASGKYCWMCSDDDISMPWTIEEILKTIKSCNPVFMYLNFAGYIENEQYDIVLKRDKHKDNVIYSDPEHMIKQLILTHFSAAVLLRDEILKYAYILDEYKDLGFVRGYFVNIYHYVILNNKHPYVFIGKICLAVRNMIAITGNNYNPITTLIDASKHYQNLSKKNLIQKETEKYVLNWFLGGFYRLVLPMKCFRHPLYTKELEQLIYSHTHSYSKFWLHMLPFLLLPWWFLIVPYILIRFIKSIYRRTFNTTPFK